MQCRKCKSRKSQDVNHLHSEKSNVRILQGTSHMICLKVTKKLVRYEFLKIFVAVRWFQYLLEGLTPSSEAASVCTDAFRFKLFDKAFLKNTLLFSTPQGFLFHNMVLCLLYFVRKRSTKFYLQS